VVVTAAFDFAYFLFTSMNLSATICRGELRGENVVRICTQSECGTDMGEYAQYRGFRIDIGDTAGVCGYDERGCAQALYHLEEIMDFRKAPLLKKGIISRKPEFSPQVVHSSYGYDDFHDEYLNRIVREGRDAMLVYVEGINRTQVGYLDFNSLIARAAKYGLDVCAYSVMIGKMLPRDPGAYEFYDGLYGVIPYVSMLYQYIIDCEASRLHNKRVRARR